MSLFDNVRKQKLLSFTLILFTLSIGVLIGTLINTSVRAAKENADDIGVCLSHPARYEAPNPPLSEERSHANPARFRCPGARHVGRR